jgi:hypothetical protein
MCVSVSFGWDLVLGEVAWLQCISGASITLYDTEYIAYITCS